MPELTDPRGPRWNVWAKCPWVPTFVVDGTHQVAVFPVIAFEVCNGHPVSYYTVSPTDPRYTLYYRELYCPTKWERLLSGSSEAACTELA